MMLVSESEKECSGRIDRVTIDMVIDKLQAAAVWPSLSTVEQAKQAFQPRKDNTNTTTTSV